METSAAALMENDVITPEDQLAQLRKRIDEKDEEMAKLLVSRIEIIQEVAKLKAQHWPNSCHIRPAREGQMHHAIAQRFTGTDFPPLAALAIWRQLIGASTHLESPLNVVTLVAHPEHAWLAREYFGVQIGAQLAPTLVDALAHIRNGVSNILILPAPNEQNEWWKGAEGLRAAELSIFAILPVVGDNMPQGAQSAVALAKIKPEESGDDISYHVHNKELIMRPGFHPEEEGIFLGAHPRAIHFGV